MAPNSVTAPSELAIPAGTSSIDSSLTVASGTVASLSIGGVFTITLKAQTGTTVRFTLSLKAGTPRPGAGSQPISVVVGGTTIQSQPVDISF